MAHTFDTSLRIPTTSVNTSNPQSGSYTCGAGATLLVVSLVYAGSTARSGGAPTYNGVALQQADIQRYGSTNPEASVEMWYMLNPPTGAAYTISVPNAGGLNMATMIASFKAQSGYTSFLDVSNGNGAVSTNPSVSVTTTADGDVIVAAVANGAQSWSGTPVGTNVFTNDNGSWGGGLQYLLQTSQGTQAMSWTFGTSEDWGVVVAAFKEAPGSQNISVDGIGSAESFGTPTLEATSVTIIDNEGYIHTVGTNAAGRAISNVSAKENVEYISKFRLGDNNSSASFRVFLRTSGNWADWRTPTSGYEIVINNTGSWQLNRIVSGTRTQIATHTWTANTTNNWVHFAVAGSTVRASVWADGSAEPAWEESVTDSSVTGAGNIQLGYFGDSGIHDLYLDQITIQEVSGSSTPTVVPTGISSAESFGTAIVSRGSVSITVTGVASQEQFGAVAVGQAVSPAGITSAESFGNSSVLPQPITIICSGISSVGAVGTPTLQSESVVVYPGGIASQEQFGTTQVNRGAVQVVPSGIGGSEQFGTHSVIPQPRNVAISGIQSAEAFGTLTLNLTIYPGSTNSQESFGVSAVLPQPVSVTPTGITSQESLGAPTLVPGATTVAVNGVQSSEALGTPTINRGSVTLVATGVGSGETLGNPSVFRGSVILAITGIASGESIGTATVTIGTIVLSPSSIGTLEAVGTPSVGVGAVTIIPVSIASSEAFGEVKINLVVSPAGISSAESFGSHQVSTGSVTVIVTGISSIEDFGVPVVSSGSAYITPVGIPSAEAFGTTTLVTGQVAVQATGISGAEQVGSLTLLAGSVTIQINSTSSAEQFGTPAVQPGAVILVPAGALSDELFGGATFIAGAVSIGVLAIESQELAGTPQIRVFPFSDDFTQANYTPWNVSNWVVEVVS